MLFASKYYVVIDCVGGPGRKICGSYQPRETFYHLTTNCLKFCFNLERTYTCIQKEGAHKTTTRDFSFSLRVRTYKKLIIH